MEQHKLRCIIAVIGDKFLGYLIANIHTLQDSMPGVGISVYYQDMSEDNILLLKDSFPEAGFYLTEFDFEGNRKQKVSQKVLLWSHAMLKENDPHLCFLDVDTITLEDFSEIFHAYSFDLAITLKDDLKEKGESGYTINSGVVLCKNNSLTREFFERWNQETMSVLADKNATEKAISLHGGVDQKTMNDLITGREHNNGSSRKLLDKGLNVLKLDCEEYNHVYKEKVPSHTKIVHYKGREWDIFFKERILPNRQYYQKYALFMETYKNALSEIKSGAILSKKTKQIGFKIPLYFQRHQTYYPKWNYIFYYTTNRFSLFSSRFWNKFKYCKNFFE